MRILLVSNYQPPHMGGIEFAAGSLKRCWEEDGHQVTWLTTDIPPGAHAPSADNIRVPAFNFLESKFQINSPLVCHTQWSAIRELIDRHDVVNVHSLAPGLSTLTLFLALRKKKPVVATQHVGVIRLKWKFLDIIQRRFICGVAEYAARRGVDITFVGAAVRDWMHTHTRIPESQLHMTPAGIDQHDYHYVDTQERGALRKKWNLSDQRFHVLFVGRFYEKKGIPLLTELAERMPDAQFTLVGSGPIQPVTPNTPNLRVIGFVSTQELRELYGAHDLFIMPSFGEGWPAVVPQAMACGLPCLISEETFEGYRKDRNMFLVAPRVADTLIQLIKQAAQGAPPLIHNRKMVSDYALSTWNWKTTARLYVELFKRQIHQEKGLNTKDL